MPRASLYLKAWVFRFFQTIGRYCDLYLSTPLPLRPTFTITIPSTVGSVPGSFELLLYAPKEYKESLGKLTEKYPLLVNFHGGGYTIGHVSNPI
jgi:acetyl esterase/lipase